MLKLVPAWSLVLALLVLLANRFWAPKNQPVRELVETKAAFELTDEEARLLQTASRDCAQVFLGFIAQRSPTQRSQFVLSKGNTVSRMVRFYSLNPLPVIAPEALKVATSGILRLPDGEMAFKALWDSQDGNLYDAVFRRENDQWLLDWDHFARYNDYPWPLFISGLGPEEGEFRLLARERLAEERKHEPSISIMLYSPLIGTPGQAGFQSPEFLVPRSGTAGQLLDAAFQLARDQSMPPAHALYGQLLDAAFQLARDGGSVFDSNITDLNPDGMIRVRVKVRRYEQENERKFEITEVLACHWYSIDDPGVQPLARDRSGQTHEPEQQSGDQ